MLSLDTLVTTMSQFDLGQADWTKVRTHLENLKQQLYTEIGNYPAPIAGCDQQFNYLLEQQRRIIQELARLSAAEEANTSITEFIHTSSFFTKPE